MCFSKNPFKIKWVFPAFFILNILTRRLRPNGVLVDKMKPVLDDAHRDDHLQSTEVIEIHSRTCHSQCGLLICFQLSRNDHHMFFHMQKFFFTGLELCHSQYQHHDADPYSLQTSVTVNPLAGSTDTCLPPRKAEFQ
jgi:hypothetical protein